MTQQGLLSLTPSLPHGLLPPTQQGFAAPQPQVSFHQLSKGFLSGSYYGMTQRTVLSQTIHNMYNTGVLSTRVTEPLPQAQQGFAEPTLRLMYNHKTQ